MVTLYAFGPRYDAPDLSPPCMKVHTLLRMAGLKYELNTNGFSKAPKGKLPFLDDDGTLVADSTFIRWHIEQKYGVDFDAGLDAVQRGDAWVYEKLCEDHLYFALLHSRWINEANFRAGPAKLFDFVPAPVRPLVRTIIRRDIRKSLHGQGTGRHSPAEIDRLAIRGIDAIAAKLGDKPWLMGDAPCAADASVHATLTGILCPLFSTPIRDAAERHPSLVAYRDRGLARWYPEFKPAV
ncbi:MAG: glutathione S-transferase family protein [Hyphomicrobium aestuarii]|nr:glutathione S-transferase family protein [Hyphomicrobium aestuarii]